MEKGIKRTDIYKGRVIDFKIDDVLLDDGTPSKREFVLHPGGVCIAMKDEDGKFLMVKQYRYVQGKEMLEFCAGKIEEGEDPDTSILREAEEELGYEVRNIRKLLFAVIKIFLSWDKRCITLNPVGLSYRKS